MDNVKLRVLTGGIKAIILTEYNSKKIYEKVTIYQDEGRILLSSDVDSNVTVYDNDCLAYETYSRLFKQPVIVFEAPDETLVKVAPAV